jgi:hypothetical protein
MVSYMLRFNYIGLPAENIELLLSKFQRFGGVTNRFFGRSPEFEREPRKDNRRRHEDSGEDDHQPLARRAIILALGVAGFFVLVSNGSRYLDYKRRRLGSALVWCGFGLLTAVMLLWWLSAFRTTWGWLL